MLCLEEQTQSYTEEKPDVLLLYVGETYEDAKRMNMDFENWLYRIVINHGDKFWNDLTSFKDGWFVE